MIDYFKRKLTFDNSEIKTLLSADRAAKLDDLQKHVLFNNNVEIINLELSKFCNRKCDYCPVSISDRQSQQSIINQTLLASIISQLGAIKYSKTISLNLYNEPLENPEFLEQVAYIRNHLPLASLIFNSNGDRLRKPILQQLASCGIRKIVVTLHPKPHQDMTFSEIERRSLTLLKKIDYPDLNTLEINDTMPFIEVFHYGVHLKIQWPDWRISGGSRGGTLDHMDENKTTRTAPCNRPFREFTIYYDGTVTPCCEVFHDGGTDTKAVAGRLTENTIFDIYASQYLAKFRQSVFGYQEKTGVCQYCHFKDTSDGSDNALREHLLNHLDDPQWIPSKTLF